MVEDSSPTKKYVGRFSYDYADTLKSQENIVSSLMHHLNGYSLDDVLVRGTACSNVTLSEVLVAGTDRFNSPTTFATEGNLIFAVNNAVTIVKRIKKFANGEYSKRYMRKGERRIARHRRIFHSVLVYRADGLTPVVKHTITKNDEYEFLVPPQEALLTVLYFNIINWTAQRRA